MHCEGIDIGSEIDKFPIIIDINTSVNDTDKKPKREKIRANEQRVKTLFVPFWLVSGESMMRVARYSCRLKDGLNQLRKSPVTGNAFRWSGCYIKCSNGAPCAIVNKEIILSGKNFSAAKCQESQKVQIKVPMHLSS